MKTDNLKMPLISFIIAAYNVKSYILDAVNSIVEQWDNRFEIIVIDDGSTDGTRQLLEEYKAKLPNHINFVLYSQKNTGISSVRNIGISLAKGEYVAYLDGDDLYLKNKLNEIVKILINTNVDCLVTNFFYLFDDDYQNNDNVCYFLENEVIRNDKENTFLINLYKGKQLYPWKYIIKADILKKYDYPLGKTYEDVNTLPLQIFSCKTIYYSSEGILAYRQRQDSIMKIKSKENILSLSSSLIRISNFIKEYYRNNIPKSLALEHSIFNLYLFTWACGDSLANKNILPKYIYKEIKSNFINANLIDLKIVKDELKNRDKRTLNKFLLFFYIPSSFYFSHYLKYKFNRLYRLLNKVRNFIYKT